jgi:hypothetical protein
MEVIQKVAVPALQVEIPMASASASTSDLSVREECLYTDLDTTVGTNASSLDP